MRKIFAGLLVLVSVTPLYVQAGPFGRNLGNREFGSRVFGARGVDATPIENMQQGSITIDGQTRTYKYYVPNGSGKLPVVIMLHGGGGNSDNAIRMTHFNQLAEKEKFIAVFPDGSGRQADKLLTWNASHCCGYAMQNNVDDVKFISNLIDKFINTQNADSKRIYVTGMSNGAMMTHKIGINLSNKVAAIATDVGTVFGDEPMAKGPLPVMMINGGLDENVPPAGGAPGGPGRRAWGVDTIPNTYAQSEYWAKNNHCKSPVKTAYNSMVDVTKYSCPSNYDVVHYLVKDNGHAWPGGRKGSGIGNGPSQSFDASEEIWKFFKAHPKQ